MKSTFKTFVALLFLSAYLLGCCPPPCTKWLVNGPTAVEPSGFKEPSVPPETEEFFFFKGKSGSLHNYSTARQAAMDDLYNKIFDAIYRKNRGANRAQVKEIAVSGVLLVDEYQVKSTTPYRHRRKKDLTSVGVKYEVIVIARFPKREFIKALERSTTEPASRS